MVNAAKVLTLATMDLYQKPELITAAKSDFDKRRAGNSYKSRVPADRKPPLTYRDK